jgi:hypothetical protein
VSWTKDAADRELFDEWRHEAGEGDTRLGFEDWKKHRAGIAGDRPTIVIEIRGGLVQEVYDNVNDLRVVVVDWDNINGPDADGDGAEVFDAVGLKRMPDETRDLVEAALEECKTWTK